MSEHTSPRRRVGRKAVGLAVGSLVVAAVGSLGAIQYVSAAGSNAPSLFVPLSPARILDTRIGFKTVDGLFAGGGALGQNATIDLQVTGRGGVPADATAVVLNVTVTAPTALQSYLTVWPTGETRPDASNLNYVANRTIPNLVVAKIGDGGKVSLYNFFGTAEVLADVAGYYTTAAAGGGVMNELSGWERISAAGSTATCTGGKKVIGGGGQGTVTESYPSANDTWTATGATTTWAICALAP